MTLLRDLPNHTLGTLKDHLADTRRGGQTQDIPLSQIELKLDAAEPTIVLAQHEVRATRDGLAAFGGWMGIKPKFVIEVKDRLGDEGAQWLLERWLETTAASAATFTFTDAGIREVQDVGRRLIDPLSMVDVASKVMGGDSAEIARLVDEPAAFSFDARVDESSRHIGGDPAVGDVTASGLRMDYNRKRNLAPTVWPYLYRLICTNGWVCYDPGLKLDTRGDTVEEVLAALEHVAELAFSRNQAQIEHLYSLREVRVDNPERELRRLAREQRIPDRSATALLDLAASDALSDTPTMFELTNLVTNLANSPAITNDGGRLILERAGGSIIRDQAARCGHCRQRVTSN